MKTKLFLGLMAVFSLVLVVGCTEATPTSGKFRAGSTVTVAANETVGDVYLSGGNVSVLGSVNGDVVAAGGNVEIRGPVNGDVIAAGGNITLDGPVRDDVRVAGGSITIRSNVDGDVITSGGTVSIGRASTVGGDLVAAGGTIRVDGTVQGDAMLGTGDATIAGTIRRNADMGVGRLVLEPTARIEGNLTYTSNLEAEVQPGAQVVGTTVRREPQVDIFGARVQPSPIAFAIAAILGTLRWIIGTFLVGLLLLWVIPATFTAARDTLATSPWKSLGFGVVVLIVAPILFIIAAIILIIVFGASALPVVAVPLGIYILLVIMTAPVVAVVVGYFIMRLAGREDGIPLWLQLLIGILVLAVLGLIPFVDGLVGFLTVLFGFGAWLLLFYRNYKRAREVEGV